MLCHSRAMASKVVWRLFARSFFSADGATPPLNCFFAAMPASRASFKKSRGVCAKREEFFTVLKMLFDAPAFGAARRDKKEEAIAVKKFLRLIKGLDRANGGIGEGHRGILLARDEYTPWNTP